MKSMRDIVLKVASVAGVASLLVLAGCSEMETGGRMGAPPPVMATPRADMPRKTAMTSVGIAPVEAEAAVAYMEQEAGDLRKLSPEGIGIVRRGSTVVVTLASDVSFGKGSADVEPRFFAAFEGLAGILNRYPATYVDIVGYADSQ